MSGSQIKLYQTDNGPCPYRDNYTWHNISFQTSEIPADGYTSLLNQGFRRSGLPFIIPFVPVARPAYRFGSMYRNFLKEKGNAARGEKTRMFVLSIIQLDLTRKILIFTSVIR